MTKTRRSGGMGGVDDLLDAGDEGGEGGHDDAAGGRGHDVEQGRSHDLLRRRVAGYLHVGRVRQQEKDAFAAQLGQPGQVRGLAHDGRVVQLEVAGVYHGPDRRTDSQAHRVGDAVGHPEGLHLETAHLYPVARVDPAQVGLVQQAGLLQLHLDEVGGEGSAVDGRLHAPEDVGQGARVVFVAVGDEEGLQAVGVLEDVGDIGDDQVHAEHVLFGEHEAGVDGDEVLAVLEEHHVLADLSESSQGYDP